MAPRMQIIYASQFVLLGFIASLCCLLVPSWRRYALYALVAPPGFAVGSFIGMFIVALISSLTTAFYGWKSILAVGIYVGTGCVGAWLATQAIRWVVALLVYGRTKWIEYRRTES